MRVETDDGVGLAVYDQGDPAGTPILFVHEFGGDRRSWNPQVRHFAATHRCVTYDARGYPASDVPTAPGAYSQERAVADAVAVLDALGIARAVVVGNSLRPPAGAAAAASSRPGRARRAPADPRRARPRGRRPDDAR